VAAEGLVKTGSGRITLTGSSVFAGATVVSAGTLALGNNGASGSVAGEIRVDAAGTLALNRSNGMTMTAAISGSGAVVQIGSGSTTLAAANSHTGATTVRAGILRLEHADALRFSPTTVAAGRLEVATNATLRVPSLTLTGGTVALSISQPQTVAVASLTVNAGRIDLGRGRIDVGPGGISAEDLRADVVAARNGGTWDGATGITSSVAASGNRAVGWLANGDGSFSVAFAAPGDLDMNGLVDLDDVIAFVGGGLYDTGLPAVWAQGDYDYNGLVDLDDVIAFVGGGLFDAGSYNLAQDLGGLSSMSGGMVAVPEPPGCASAAWGAALAALGWRRLRRRDQP
jgi:autotransporter-associated beta strand protein